MKASWLTIFAILLVGFSASMSAEVVTFPSGTLELKGVVYKPEGKGPFPAVLYTGVRCGASELVIHFQWYSDAVNFKQIRWAPIGSYGAAIHGSLSISRYKL